MQMALLCQSCCAAVDSLSLLLSVDARKLERLLPMLVALRGRVESNDPKKCELSDRKAVIHEVSSRGINKQQYVALAWEFSAIL